MSRGFEFTLKAGTQLDSFGRQRVSNPQTIFDSKQIHDNLPLRWDDQETSGGSTTTTFTANTARTRIGVALNTDGKRVRQTFMRFNYQPGKGQYLVMTGVLSSAVAANVITEMGLGDDKNGLFLVASGTTVEFVRRTFVTGLAVDNVVTRANWDDPMDGTGPSGKTVTFDAKAIIFWIDMEWLGTGDVRFGFFVDGQPFTAYTDKASDRDLGEVYMSTPNLPVRYAIEANGGGSNAATTMDHDCTTVMSDGGSDNTGVLRHVSTDGTHIDADVENTTYAILGIRLKSAFLGTTIKIIKAWITEHQGSNHYIWKIIFNPTVAGVFTYNDQTNSAIQMATGATANTVTGGTEFNGGAGESAQKGGTSIAEELVNAIHLGVAIDGTTFDTMVLCAKPVGGSTNLDIEGGLTLRELS